MAQKPLDPNFGNTNFGLEPYIPHPSVDEDFTQSIAHMLIWDSQNNRWNRVLSDPDGRLYVSTSPTQSSAAVQSSVNVTNVSTAILAANPSRKEFIVSNLGAANIFIGLGATALTTTGILLAPGAVFGDDKYTGAISGITAAGNSNLSVTEL